MVWRTPLAAWLATEIESLLVRITFSALRTWLHWVCSTESSDCTSPVAGGISVWGSPLPIRLMVLSNWSLALESCWKASWLPASALSAERTTLCDERLLRRETQELGVMGRVARHGEEDPHR